MFKQAHFLCVSITAFSLGLLQADQPDDGDSDFFSSFPMETLSAPETSELPSFSAPSESPSAQEAEKKPSHFKSFTGKIKGKKVRLRNSPDLESAVVQELEKGQYLSIIDEVEDFYVTEAPSSLKAYIFRSFVLDNVVEGNRVNVRLHPNTEAPILLHLNAGDSVCGAICDENHKWLEISAPKQTKLYVSKNFIENVGGPEVKTEHEQRLTALTKKLEEAQVFSALEMQKEYNDINFDQMNQGFQVVIQEFSDFPDIAEKAKDLLSNLQEQFIDKRIAYMESQVEEQKNQEESFLKSATSALKDPSSPTYTITDKMKTWEPVEEALFASWARMHEARELSDYQLEQSLTAERVTGIIEPYQSPIKNKPGDFIVRVNDLPVGYVYSTVVNLQSLVGKKVSLIGSPRPNNNFAFPAYFVIGVDQ